MASGEPKHPRKIRQRRLRSREPVIAKRARGLTDEVLDIARASGLLDEKGSRISGRVSAALVEQAKRRTGITENTQLIEFALASLALEDNFARTFKDIKGAVAPAIDLGF